MLTVLCGLASIATCDQTIEEPPCPPIEIPIGTGECSAFCDCPGDTIANRVYRLTRMEIDEPEEFAELLNMQWESDIVNNVLNVLFAVKEYETGTAAAFDHVSFVVGPGWRSPVEPEPLVPEEGQPSESVVDSYCHLDGMTVDLSVKPYHGNQCIFKSTEATALYFHTGPKTSPFVCAPDLVPANSIPVKNLKVRMGFNEDCTGIVDGYLEGCITIEDANRICMCLVSGACPLEPVNEGTHEEGDLSGYCRDKCGKKWLSFGESVAMFKLKPSCITPDGAQGYRLQGFVTAVEISDKYDGTRSDNCAP